MIKPPHLRPGDTVATISLSWGGAHSCPDRYRVGKRELAETFGLNVVETRHALRPADWLARNPEARADDLMEAFSDNSIQGIVSVIGGEDSIRLLPFIDLDVIRNNPKVLIGYSDTTVSHMVCHKAGLTSFYGPAILAGFAENGGIFPYTEASVRSTLFTTDPPGRIAPNDAGWTVEHLDWNDPELQSRKRKLTPTSGWRWIQGEKRRSGPLIGGCIEVLDWLRGTSIWPDDDAWKGAILFLETSEEAPSPSMVRWFFRTYAALGILDRINGILFGRPGGQIPVEDHVLYDDEILRVVAEESGRTDIPIVTGMDFGHTDPMMVLPYGVEAEIDPVRRQFSLLESGVTKRL